MDRYDPNADYELEEISGAFVYVRKPRAAP